MGANKPRHQHAVQKLPTWGHWQEVCLPGKRDGVPDHLDLVPPSSFGIAMVSGTTYQLLDAVPSPIQSIHEALQDLSALHFNETFWSTFCKADLALLAIPMALRY